jgi:hypothetical protein
MGDAFVVGLEGTPEEVTQDANLAHNIFNANFFNDVFNGRINFSSRGQFMKYLIYKSILGQGLSIRDAAKTARRVLTEQTIRQDFMRQIRQHQDYHYNISNGYGARDGDSEWEE